MKITILIDNDSWIIPYGKILNKKILEMGHNSSIVYNQKNIKEGDLLILMGCVKIFKNLSLNKNNIVIHESDLPKGKGWSPLTWQILEGKNKIPITLFEATNKIDSGKIYIRDVINFEGHELIDEIKNRQGLKTIEIVLKYINENPIGKLQIGNSTFYKKRKPVDSELDVNKSILEQFQLLRVCHNEDYPAFFKIGEQKYYINIFKNI